MKKKEIPFNVVSDIERILVKEASCNAREHQSVLKVRSLILAGICHFLDYKILNIDEVGVVIVAFNPDSSVRRALKNLQRFGYATIQELANALNHGQLTVSQKERRQLRRDIVEVQSYFKVVFGVHKKNGVEYVEYKTPFWYSKSKVNGFFQVRITRDSVFEAAARAQLVNPALPISDCLQIVRDFEAIKRFFGEKTIDSAKKPDPDVMGGIPLMNNRKRVKMRSRTPMTLDVNWDTLHAVIGGPDMSDSKILKRVLADGTVVETLDENDCWHQNRYEFFGYSKEVADELMKVCGQRLPEQEVQAIIMAAKKHKDVCLALLLLKQILQSASTAIKVQKTRYETLYKKGSYRAETWSNQAKEESNEFYPEIRNQARLICELGKVSDPVERVRCALACVLFTNLNTKSQIKWDKLSGFAGNVLDVEWQIYKLYIEKDWRWTPQETMDEVSFADGIEVTDEILAAINETVAEFVNGAVYDDEGEEILVGDTELNGKLTIRVADDKIYACKSLVEVLNGMIPKANSSHLLFVTNEEMDVERFKGAVKQQPIALAPMNHDAILVTNPDGSRTQVGRFRTASHFVNDKPVNSRVTNKLYGGNNGVFGTVTKVIHGVYDSPRGRKKIAIGLIETSRPVCDTEAEYLVPDKKVSFEPAKPVFNFTAPVSLEDLGLTF